VRRHPANHGPLRFLAMPRIIRLAPLDYDDWHAGLITIRPWQQLEAPEDAIIEDIGRDFEVVWSEPTRYGKMDAVIMDDCAQYYLARVVNQPAMPDADLLDAVIDDPDDGERWLNLTRWFTDHGRADEAAALQVYWPTLRDSLAIRRSIEAVLDDLRRHASILGACAREIEERAYDR
jgi:hypothetical protein